MTGLENSNFGCDDGLREYPEDLRCPGITLPSDREDGKKFRIEIVSRIRMLADADPTGAVRSSYPGGDVDADRLGGTYEMTGDAYLKRDGDRLSFSYNEYQDGDIQYTEISYDVNSPGLLTVYKSGFVSAVLMIEEGRRHSCSYKTPFMDFELVLSAMYVENNLTENGGRLSFEYKLELKGAVTQRTEMNIKLTPCSK